MVGEPVEEGVFVQLSAGRSQSAAEAAVGELKDKHDAQLGQLKGHVTEFNHAKSGRWFLLLDGAHLGRRGAIGRRRAVPTERVRRVGRDQTGDNNAVS